MTVAQNELLPPELAQAIRCRIAERVGTLHSSLEVEATGKRVAIRGRVPTYYLKQLVLQCALEVAGSESWEQIDLNVQVVRIHTTSDT